MTHTLKTALGTLALITVAGTASAGDTFNASFHYDNTLSASANLEIFENTATQACRAEMSRVGFRITEGRREMQACEKQLLKSAVRRTKSRSLMASYAASTVNAVYKPKPSVATHTAKAVLKNGRDTFVKLASN